MCETFSDIDCLLNRLTGLNRFQQTKERALRMAMRVSFLEQALLGLGEAHLKMNEVFLAMQDASKLNLENLEEA